MNVLVGELRRGRARPVVAALSGIRASRVVGAATVVSAAAWAVLAGVRESLLLDQRQELGHMTQTVWATAHGHFLQVTETGGLEVSRLGIHVDPIIALLAPLWLAWPSPLMLLTVQAMALAVGALPLFWLARKRLPLERDAALLALAYLLCPTVVWKAILDFEPASFAVPLLLFAIWFLDEDRLVPFALAAGAAVLCQEQIGLIVGCLGIWYAFGRRRPRAGLTIAVVGVAITVVDFYVVLRHFSGGTPFEARFGGSPAEIVRDVFTRPVSLLSQINQWDLLGLLVALPVLGVCLGSSLMLAAAPQVAMLLLSRRPSDWSWFGTNVLILIPFVYAATALALGRVAARSRRNRRPRVGALHVFAASVAVFAFVGPPSSYGRSLLFPPHPSVDAQRDALSLVPAGASVATTPHLAVPLANRRHLGVFPVLKGADWVLVDSRDVELPDMAYLAHRVGIRAPVDEVRRQPQLMRRELRLLERSRQWLMLYREDGIYVFRRIRG